MRDKIRKYLGINELLEESQVWNKELSNQISIINTLKYRFDDVDERLEGMTESIDRLRMLISDHWAENQPASIMAIDAIFKETRDRLDVVMVCLDSFKDSMVRR